MTAIRAFEAAGRNENFTAAAAELGMTQAAVSYQVKALEERLGAALFVREKGRARLTPLGSRLLPPISQAFDAMEAVFASEREEDEALLTVTTTYTFANTWLAWRLGTFQIAHPELAVRMAASDALADLRSGDADVAIRAGRADWEGLEQVQLFEVDFTPMASPECLAEAERKRGRRLEPADLLDLPLISPQDSWWKQWLGDWGVTSDGAPRHAGIRLDVQAHEGNAAMGGQGFALLTPLLWASDLAHGRLVRPFPDKLSRRGWSYWLVYPPERRMVPKIKRFREWLLAEFASSIRASAQPALDEQ
ncbi:MAG TPA: LysR substrate-binding domain-containing protein [Sphingomicrobium sp.]|nr:LysR substrate-binding domain-containing protein [Sphingomicrobium sp.]